MDYPRKGALLACECTPRTLLPYDVRSFSVSVGNADVPHKRESRVFSDQVDIGADASTVRRLRDAARHPFVPRARRARFPPSKPPTSRVRCVVTLGRRIRRPPRRSRQTAMLRPPSAGHPRRRRFRVGGEVLWIVVGHLYRVFVSPDEHLLREVDADRPAALHQLGARLRIAEEE